MTADITLLATAMSVFANFGSFTIRTLHNALIGIGIGIGIGYRALGKGQRAKGKGQRVKGKGQRVKGKG
ncbi:hypothetical protein VF14_09985 [Nostoc linckia z18]|nr:hypothetical protein VF11_18330 [Nostoc linckia z14]PHK24883.1 hypothetical protein VF12_37255 [Nostoc linckia z15]PHK35500.1 hypothetical protein VF14_09985 [Nostoc linckia z18]